VFAVGLKGFWKKNMEVNRITIIETFMEVIMLFGFISIKTPIESNYGFWDLAGLEQANEFRTIDQVSTDFFNATN